MLDKVKHIHLFILNEVAVRNAKLPIKCTRLRFVCSRLSGYRALTSGEALAVPCERVGHALAEAAVCIFGRIAIRHNGYFCAGDADRLWNPDILPHPESTLIRAILVI